MKYVNNCQLITLRMLSDKCDTARKQCCKLTPRSNFLKTEVNSRAKEGFQYWYRERPKPTSCLYSHCKSICDVNYPIHYKSIINPI